MKRQVRDIMMVDLRIDSKSALVIGGGKQATRKAIMMAKEGCHVTIASPVYSDDIMSMAKDGQVELMQGNVSDESVLDRVRPDLLVAATSNHKLNRLLVNDAKTRGIISYSASDPDISDYAHVAVAERNGVRVAVSTGGRSPVAARDIRDRIVNAMGRDFERMIQKNPRPQGEDT